MGGVDIEMTREIKILGLIIDDKLTFEKHVTSVCKKALGIYKQLSRAARISWGLHPEIIRQIYMAAVEPVIMYAAGAWAPAAQKIGIKKKLNTVQRGFAQKMAKTYRTVSLHSALLLAGLLPLDLRIREAANLFETRNGISRQIAGDREVETPVRYCELPHPASRSSYDFEWVADGAALARHSSEALKIYTDGRKIDGKVGAVLSIWENGAEIRTIKIKLEQCCTVYQAELCALWRATEEAKRRAAEECYVYCDSRSALETVARGASLHPLAVKARSAIQDIESSGKRIKLCWIKAHIGLEGNERADELAKAAALHRKTRADYDLCPLSFVRRQLRQQSLGEWETRYTSGETAKTTKLFFPNAVAAYHAVRKINMDGLTAQIFTGHGGFSEYLHRFKCKESPSCSCDPEKEQSLIHIVTECVRFLKVRNDIETKLGTNINKENLANLISNKKTKEPFLIYCKNITSKIIMENK